MTTIIGLDFGSHTCSVALWHEDKGSYEVFADELGSRVIPCVVAYRGDEVIVGQAAVAQQHKNPSNTFLDIRDLILNPEVHNVFVPAIEKEIPVQELVSHFFRNIHNQVKMQVGKVIRDCVMSIPCAIDDSVRSRLYEAAQAGGIRIKSLVADTACTLMAYGLDNPALSDSTTLVIDIGWGETEVGCFSVSKGLFFPQASVTSKDISGKILVKLLSEHCVKDFQRKSKLSCVDSVRSMIRLRAQCEEIMKQLSTVQESNIDIDSLYEGVDYSSKISRARFEDIAGIPLMQLKSLINQALISANIEHSMVTTVCIAGGLAAMPKVYSIIKTIFPQASFPKTRFETAEALCIGASLHARFLFEQGMIDSAPLTSASTPTLSHSLFLGSCEEVTGALMVCRAGSVLPLEITGTATITSAEGFVRLFAMPPGAASAVTLGDLVFASNTPQQGEVVINLAVSANGAICLSLTESDSEGAAVSQIASLELAV